MEAANSANSVRDHYHITQGVFYLLSTLICTPDVFLSISRQYWMYIFRPLDIFPGGRPPGPPPPPPPIAYNGPAYDNSTFSDEFDYPHRRSPMQVTFTSAFGIAGHFSNLLSILLVTIYTKRLPLAQVRIGKALVINLIFHVINLGLTMVHTDRIQVLFYAYALALTIILNCATSFIFVGLFELVVKFPTFYAASLLSGQPICTMISTLIDVALRPPKLHPKTHGTIYFSVGTLLSLFTTVVYFYVIGNSKYFIYRIQQPPTKVYGIESMKMIRVLLKAKWYYAALFYLIGTTNLVHTGFTALIVPMKIGTEEAGAWENVYFVPIITFFGYSFCNLIGRELAKKVSYWRMRKLEHRVNTGMLLMAAAVLRSFIVPLLLFCNGQARKILPVYFGDNAYITILAIFGLTEGILVNVTLLKIFMFVDDDERREAFLLIPFGVAFTATISSSINMGLINLI